MDSDILTADILESISDGVFTVDKDWKITSFNRAAEQITGVSRDKAIGQNCFEVFKSNMCESECPLRKTMESGCPVIDRAGFCLSAKGKRIPISVSTALLVDSDGTVLGGAETFRDLRELENLRQELAERRRQTGVVSKSPAMETIMAMLPAVSDSNASVLLVGETGTGKEVLARTIHEMSSRSEKPFVAVNCGALPENLLESELFGYRKGAFTGADRDKPGRFALAEGGTLLLDEIGEISQAFQVKLLRVLQEREYEPLGGTKPVHTDVRILCATHRDLRELMEDGRFRQDLYYRINVITLDLPPLRNRREDIADLAETFLETAATHSGKKIAGFTPAVFRLFYAYDWPGNIRELQNVIERAVVLTAAGVIDTDVLPQELQASPNMIQTKDSTDAPGSEPGELSADETDDHADSVSSAAGAREKAERACIIAGLEKNGWHRGRTAESLGMNKATLWRKMKKYGISGS